MGTVTLRDLYLDTLRRAWARRARGGGDEAIQSFLALNAAYFLGEWLPARLHERLVRGLAGRLDGLADAAVPAREPAASQLAQHVRELAAAFGPVAWTDRMAALTASTVPPTPQAWDAPALAALRDLRRDGALSAETRDRLLLAHARRRLWQLPHGGETPVGEAPASALAFARRAAAGEDGRAIQAAEALLAEVVYGGVRLSAPSPGPRRLRTEPLREGEKSPPAPA